MKRRTKSGTWVSISRATAHGKIFAPPMHSEESDQNKAIEDVKSRSRLSEYESWTFE